MKRLVTFLINLALVATIVAGCNPTFAAGLPVQTLSSPIAVTITTPLTFQTVLNASTTRVGCSIQNTSSDVEYVFFGPLASATPGASFQLQPGQPLNCAAGDVVASDTINMTSATISGATAVVQAQ